MPQKLCLRIPGFRQAGRRAYHRDIAFAASRNHFFARSVMSQCAQPDSISHFGTSGGVAGSCLTVVIAPPTRALGAQTSRPCPRSTTSSPSALDIVAPTAVRRPIFHHHRCPCIMSAAVIQRCRVEMRMKAARKRAQTRYRMRGRSRRRACSRRCEGRQTRSSPSRAHERSSIPRARP